MEAVVFYTSAFQQWKDVVVCGRRLLGVERHIGAHLAAQPLLLRRELNVTATNAAHFHLLTNFTSYVLFSFLVLLRPSATIPLVADAGLGQPAPVDGQRHTRKERSLVRTQEGRAVRYVLRLSGAAERDRLEHRLLGALRDDLGLHRCVPEDGADGIDALCVSVRERASAGGREMQANTGARDTRE